jgi:hypothetical protein
MPKKKRGSSLGRFSAAAKRMKANSQTEGGQTENAARALAAYHARSQSTENSVVQRHQQVGMASPGGPRKERLTGIRLQEA